jgi:sugar/nucleoside kinase (ribokinase family)
MPRHYDVITVGETTLDAFMTIHDSAEKAHLSSETGELCFKYGEKINVEKYDFQMGGNATNVAVGLARLGVKATLCSEIGDDEFSIKIRNSLASERIERLLMIQTPGPSSFSVIINYKSDRTLFIQDVEREHDFQLDDISAQFVYLTSLGNKWENAYNKVLDFAAGTKNCKIAFNPGHLQLSHGRETVHKVLQNSHILFVNKEEAELLLFNHYSKKIDNSQNYIKELCEELRNLGPEIVIITNGKHGSYALDSTGELCVQGLVDGKLVERTGAGDAFASGFLAAMVHNLPINKAMEWGAENAASVVGHVGAEAGLLRKHEMDDRV